jgi:gliding motility-associated-like protein
MVVYDRWGEILFESSDATIGWDGTYAGATAKEGLYTWTIRFKDATTDRKRVYAGHVALIR